MVTRNLGSARYLPLMDANGIRNTVHNSMAADDSMVITTVHATIGEGNFLVEVGDRGPLVQEDRVDVTIWRHDREVKFGEATGPDEATAIRSAWSKAKSQI